MPTSLRRRPQSQPPPADPFSDSEDEAPEEPDFDHEGDMLEDDMHAIEGDEGDDDLDDMEPAASPTHLNTAPPPHLREISTLASWTVSSSKPGCSIPQLRSPSTSQFWQSDGPQPHYLNIHFFKLVRIVGLRLFLDFDLDESYTPTRIIFLAGSGNNDLVEWGEMRLEQPRGWVWADFSGVAEPESNDSDTSSVASDDDDDDDEEEAAAAAATAAAVASEGEEHGAHTSPLPSAPPSDTSELENTMPGPSSSTAARPPATNATATSATSATDLMQVDSSFTVPNDSPSLTRPTPRHPFNALNTETPSTPPAPPARRPKKPKMPVLRAHLVQIKILENHQNGKDTHLRGLQVFARDTDRDKAPRVSGFSSGAEVGMRVLGGKREGAGATGAGAGAGAAGPGGRREGERQGVTGFGLRAPGKSLWDNEPSIR